MRNDKKLSSAASAPSEPSALRPLTDRERAALAQDLAGYRRLHAEARRELRFHARMAVSAWRGFVDTDADFWRRQALAHEADAGEHQAQVDWLRSVIRRAEQEVEMPNGTGNSERGTRNGERGTGNAVWAAAWFFLGFALAMLAVQIAVWCGVTL